MANVDNLKQLEKIRKELNEADQNKSKLEGKREQILTNITDLGHGDVKATEKAKDKMVKTVEKLDQQFAEKMDTLKEKYPVLFENE